MTGNGHTNQYDTILQSLKKGTLITLNNSINSSTPSDALEVKHSKNNETYVLLKGRNNTE